MLFRLKSVYGGWHGFGGMGFWARLEGKGSWIFGSLVEGKEATWEKKARELGQKRKGRRGGMLSLN